MFRWGVGVQWGEGSKGANIRGIEGDQRENVLGGGDRAQRNFLLFEIRF